jgi:uncharacterized protein
VLTHLSIPRGPITLAADLYTPDDADAATPLPTVVLSTPGSSVKEQIGANYASRLATYGFAAITFDPVHQGESGGNLRDLEDPYQRSEDISFVIDALPGIAQTDESRVGMLGICAGGGYAVYTSRTDHRIKALGTVVAGNMGASWRAMQEMGAVSSLDALADERTEEGRSGELNRVQWLPNTLDEAAAVGATDIDTTAAITFYRTPRGGHERSTNLRLTRSDSVLAGFDAFHLVDPLLTQPLQVIVGGRRGNTGQYERGIQLLKMAPNPVDLMVVKGAGHYDMYDVPEYVDAAVERLARFYGEYI